MRKKNPVDVTKQMLQDLTVLYLIIIVAVFPFYLHNYYLDLVLTKKNLFQQITICFLILAGILCVVQLIKAVRTGKITWKLCGPDICAVVFAVTLIVSCLLSPYGSEAWLGTEGRRLGGIFLLLCICAYLMVSGFYTVSSGLWMVFVLANLGMFLFIAIQFCGVDLLELYKNLASYQHDDFIGTLGNVNINSGYCSTVTVIFMAVFCVRQEKLTRMISYILIALGTYACICTRSDSWLMAVAGGTLVLLFWALGDVKTLKSWGGAVSGLFVGSLAMRLTDLIDQMGDLQIKHLGYLRKQKIQYLMVSDKILLLEAALLVLLFVLLKTKAAHFLVKYGRKLLAALVILCVAGVLFYIFPLEDSFGTNRGYIWKRTLANFADYPFLEKLFGCGPNCFLKAMEKNYGTEMRSLYGDPYLDAHNEILQFLAVTGIFGALSYLGLQVSLVRSCIRSYKKEPFAIVGCAGMVAYFMQGLVNNPQVFTTPLYFLFMGVVAAKVRNQDPKSSSKFSFRRLRKS